MGKSLLLCFSALLLCFCSCMADIPCGQGLDPYTTDFPGYCAWVYATGLTTPRGITVDSAGQTLVTAGGRIVGLNDLNNNGIIESGESYNLTSTALNIYQSIVIRGGYVYVANGSSIFRYSYTAGQNTDLGAAQTVVSVPLAMNPQYAPKHPFNFDASGALYIIMPTTNDSTTEPGFAQVLKCNLDLTNIPAGGYISSTACFTFASGNRDSLSIAFDGTGRAWLPDNGQGIITRPDLGQNLAVDNPADRIYTMLPGKFYGFPYCFAEGQLPPNVSMGFGSLWANGPYAYDGVHTDDWCRNPANNQPANIYLTPHTVPLGLTFHTATSIPGFPSSILSNGLLVSEHGSSTGAGYSVVNYALDANWNVINPNSYSKLFGPPAGGKPWIHRPVASAVRLGGCGGSSSACLLVTDDRSGAVIAFAINATQATCANSVVWDQSLVSSWNDGTTDFTQWSVTLRVGSKDLYSTQFSVVPSVTDSIQNIWNVNFEGNNKYSVPSWVYSNGVIPAGSSSFSFGYIKSGTSPAAISITNEACLPPRDCTPVVSAVPQNSWQSDALYQQYQIQVTNTNSRTLANFDVEITLAAGSTIDSSYGLSLVSGDIYRCQAYNLPPASSPSFPGCGYTVKTANGSSSSSYATLAFNQAVCI